ncbi:acetyl-CoA hydrolase/transferase family protein [Amycolatopsis echigonensis]|uniref:Acetyl-CoA hydrolase/transferase family protein n=1 Tax=Amycolatopsis echigonensis TaxID=2576905 RepID=A0A8E2B6K4_9PSEU|nr:acetyl-CoA hydrolase/transferase family protein [Amycolatopsis echigonensis]MBB2502322.1 acetyl-CoA hydrolase/transferase family protein [Amycolatopsis echigonensis]
MMDLKRFIPEGAGIWWGQASAEPTPLVHALLDQIGALGSHRAFCGLTWDKRLTRELPPELELMSYGALGELRKLSREGRLTVVPCHYSALPRLFAERSLPSDVGLVQVSAPDADGLCSLGVGADYAADAVAHTPVLLAEINHRMPVTRGTPKIPLQRFAATVETDRPLAQAPGKAADDVELAIAQHVADLVEDGDTLQMGVGSLPSAVLDALTGHTDLGFHSGMISDGVLRLADKGVLTGARKEIDPGVIVTGAALGTAELYDRLPELPVEFRPASYTHAPSTLASLRSLVSINSAIEVDLTGQVGAEIARGAYLGAVGGQADFSRAAALTGARSIITVRARAGSHSTIVPALHGGVVTTSRSDVDYVVTEYGAAALRGCDLAERARRLVAVAAPEHREALSRGVQP